MTYRMKTWLLFALCAYSAICAAGPYKSGVHQWDVAEGKLTLMSGVMTDNAVQTYLNYTFYLESVRDKTLYQIPVVDSKDTSKFKLTITESSTGDEAIQDATIVTKQKNTWLLIGEKNTAEDASAPAPVSVRIYKLVAGYDGDWAYSFQFAKAVHYAKAKRYTVEKALSENASGLQ